MKAEGPGLAELIHWLSECPTEILAEPLIAGKGVIHVAAVASDVLREMGGPGLTSASAERFEGTDRKSRNRLRTIAVAAWLFHHPFFKGKRYDQEAKLFLEIGLDDVLPLVDAAKWVSEPDRREELVRSALAALELRPKGETRAQAEDRLTTLDTVKRQRLLKDTKLAQERIKQIQEAMRQKAAEEAAAKYSRE